MYQVRLFILTLLIHSGTAWAIDQERLDQCFECHGHQGVSQRSEVPTIAGLSEKTLSQALHAYRQGQRKIEADPHQRLANSDKRIKVFAQYFAQQAFIPALQSADAERAEHGQLLHLDYCEKCHRNGGQEDHLGSGILAGQQLAYLRRSLNAFFSGERQIPEKKSKRLEALLEEQDREAFEDLLHFYAAQGAQ